MESIIKIGALLREKGWFISTAESCTGGNLGTLLSKYSGSSSFYKGSIICYSTSMKLNILEIEEQLIKKYSWTPACNSQLENTPGHPLATVN